MNRKVIPVPEADFDSLVTLIGNAYPGLKLNTADSRFLSPPLFGQGGSDGAPVSVSYRFLQKDGFWHGDKNEQVSYSPG
ncbi:hypothetical protein [Brevibacillus nitrificans]|uniref:hypothetical protein n=1 Tax=Brevibacillus nitrificans TaxID=651560 RepID=UPI0028673FA0|nr:hypothetical protein [Brevibacillus nitrificans]MDR7315730.1 hypothetical protein [Brevibacillus nitrificans]